MKKVTIYSTETCHFCHLAKEFFNEHNVAYDEFNVSTDLVKRQEMVSKSGQIGVPVIDVDGQIIIGFNESIISKALGI